VYRRNRTHQGRRRARRVLIGAALLGGSAVALAGCSSLDDTTNTSDAKPVSTASATAGSGGGQSGCDTALKDISTYGPSTVELLAKGREAVNKATVQLLVYGLDSAADTADSPQAKQDIQNVANDYDDFFNLTTDAQAIPVSVLLKDTVDLKFVCG
jgi:hypothetical protein